jgi:hypothetical protein
MLCDAVWWYVLAMMVSRPSASRYFSVSLLVKADLSVLAVAIT